MKIPRSTFYYKKRRKKQPTDQELLKLILKICEEFPRYGYRRVTAELKRQGFRVNRKRVHRLMRENNLLCRQKKRFRVCTTDSNHLYPIYPNRLKTVGISRLNQVWVADLTYIWIASGFVYLAVILDVYSRKVIGYALSERIDREVALVALKMALENRKPPVGCIHHSDRGVQYASHDYTDLLKANHFLISMSRKGNPYDNAYAESFMKTLKYEEVYLSEYQTIQEVALNIFRFIEEVYNQRRLHSSIGYLPPAEFESELKKVS
jgi:putative transposase